MLEIDNFSKTTKTISKYFEKVAKGQLNHITINHNAKYWFATPETTEDPSKLTELEKRIYEELIRFKKRERESIRPLDNVKDRKTFLESFNWHGSVLTDNEKKTENILLEFNDIFTRRRLDIGCTSKFSVKLTPNTDRPYPIPKIYLKNRSIFKKSKRFHPLQKRSLSRTPLITILRRD